MAVTPERPLRPKADLDASATAIEDVDGSKPARRSARLQPGEKIPGTNYLLIRWLGEGGMGTVYLAENVEIGRKVAIKSLHPHLVRKKKLAKVFRMEARASASIGAPNIIDVLDFHELADGRLLYVMEYLDGTSLESCVREGLMPAHRLIPILRQVCKGLYAAHEEGIVHRDIKPENIMLVARDKRSDFAKVVDFGIAALLSEADENRPRAGTPTYIAPEQVRKGGFDGRADMYSLACTAYELLTGRPPFEAETIRGLLHAHLDELPVPPSERIGSENVPEAFEAVLMRCLEKYPEDRYDNMAELEAAICEAQIQDGIMTAWDDLPPPDDIDAERRTRLLTDMPRDRLARPRPRWIVPALIATALLSGGMITYLAVGGDNPIIAAEGDELDRLTNNARAAAGQALWVIPALDNPTGPTALTRVRELEALGKNGDKRASQRATELRKEFAQALVRQGDRYLDQPGGRPFAYEFYAQAIAFEPDNARARAVGGFSAPVTAMIAADAEKGEYTQAQLEQGEFTRALAKEDPEARIAALQQARQRSEGRLPLSTAGALDTIMRGFGAQGSNGDGTVVAANTVDDGSTTNDFDAIEPEDPDNLEDPDASAAAPTRDRPKSRKLSAQAKVQAQKGNSTQAEGLFHKALSADRYNASALAGLGDIYFNRGNYSQALTYRKRATRVSKTNAGYRIALGDAYFKVLRYADALREYKEARRLGSKSAASRISKVEARL